MTMCGKNFLWVGLHGNGTALNTQESGSHADTLRECHICRTQFSVIIHAIRSVQTQLQSTVAAIASTEYSYRFAKK